LADKAASFVLARDRTAIGRADLSVKPELFAKLDNQAAMRLDNRVRRPMSRREPARVGFRSKVLQGRTRIASSRFMRI